MSSRDCDGRVVGPVLEPATGLDGSAHRLPGLTHLAELLLLSRIYGEDPWQRALSAAELAAFGLSVDDLRLLLFRGLLAASPARKERGEGGTKYAAGSRSTNRMTVAAGAAKPPTLGPRSKLILTDAGLAFVTKHPRHLEPSPPGNGQGESVTFSPPPLVSLSSSTVLPHYDIESRELSVAGVVILRFPVQARNLAAVLAALELSGWKLRVPKPLNGRPDGDEPQHLADAVYSLNQRQTLIEFHADGGALRWEWRPKAKTTRHSSQQGKSTPQARRVRQKNRENVD